MVAFGRGGHLVSQAEMEPEAGTFSARHMPSLRTTLIGLMSLLLGLEVLGFGLRLNEALNDFYATKRMALLNQTSDQLLQAGRALAFLRGRTLIVLRESAVTDAPHQDFIDSQHDALHKFVDEARRAAPDEMEEGFKLLSADLAALEMLRPESKVQMAQPRELRSTAFQDRWRQAGDATMEQISRLLSDCAQLSGEGGSAYLRLSYVKMHALELRNQVGNEVPMILSLLQQGVRASPPFMLRVAALRGHSDASWLSLSRDIEALNLPALTQALQTGRGANLSVLYPLEDRVMAGEILTPDAFLAVARPANDTIVSIGEVAGRESNRLTDERQGQARLEVLLTLAQMLLALTLGGGAILVVWKRVVAPLDRLTAVVRDLVAGKMGVHVPHGRRGDEMGELARGLKAFRDSVRMRLSAEEELDILRHRLDFLVNASPSIIYARAPGVSAQPLSGEMSFCSEGIRQLGYDPQEVLADPNWWNDHLHPDDKPRILAEFSALNSTGGMQQTYRLRSSNGQWRWVIDHLSVVRTEKGAIQELVGAVTDITALKQTEQALGIARGKLKAVQDAIPDIMLQLDGQGCCVDWHIPDSSIMPLLPANLLGARLNMLFPPSAAELLQGLAQALLRDGKPRTTEFDYPVGDSLQRLEIRLVPLADDGLLAMVRDVTALRRAERQAREQLNFLATLVDTIPSGLYWRDAQGRFLGCNSMYAQMIGHSAEDVKGHTLEEVFDPEIASSLAQLDMQLLENGGTYSYESIIPNNREYRTALLAKAIFRDDEGRPAGVVGAVVDITERKRNEALLETINWLQTQFITDQTDAALANGLLQRLIDFAGCHGGFLALTAPNQATIDGMRVVASHSAPMAAPEQEKIGITAVYQSIRETGKAWRPYCEDFPTLPVLCQPDSNFLAITLESPGRLFGLVGLIDRPEPFDAALMEFLRPLFVTYAAILSARQDDQRRRAYEKDLAAAQASLQDKASELARSNKELESFAYVASHDLRQPLRMVSSYVTLLERRYADALDDNAREFIAFARDGAQRMDRMIVDLLEYSRIGRLTRPMEPCSLLAIAQEAKGYLGLAASDANATIEIVEPLPAIVGDSLELVRLFQNLLGNAIKYRSPDRPPVITISASRADREWVVSIKDNGIGIAPEHFERIFGIFQRLHTREEYDGTGIGLAVCKKIAEHHGGRIWVRSTPGEGSEFMVAFPDERPREQT